MERLTTRIKDGDFYTSVIDNNHDVMDNYVMACDRLADYEDTGLTPEQIEELKYRDIEKEISETQSYGVCFYECPICNEPVHEKDNFCCKCGQRLKRKKEN